MTLPRITTHRDTVANTRLRQLMIDAPEVAADLRLDAADDRHTAQLAEQGHTHSQCNRCGAVRVLSWRGGECNQYDANGENEMCGGVYQPVKLLPASNAVLGAVGLPVRVGEGAA